MKRADLKNASNELRNKGISSRGLNNPLSTGI
jgi:hypothetical protein